ncbi:uncharacterized protein N0V89_001713 [Didymosphaeria variabile]|uniref:Short-chain dehydrogenases/reductase n=1 Tax=Didymosphaeria variabile TaxID=1932322 RepID=A0A9W8XSQ8_9PLEO|nr:uncharacterized protein N0V89_001713 [Didymosphaeria variabile]KAJ4357138.1 hypothetical protein N0V89_001713 [Didymosphaeria variabile]
MVTLNEAIASNKRIASSFPDGLVAVFIGGTSGVGEYTVKAFAKYVSKPRAYVVGRSKEAADRIIHECQRMNSEGRFEFIAVDVSLLQNIDDVCRQIRSKESAINILFQSQGSMGFTKGISKNVYSSNHGTKIHEETSEGLPLVPALALHGRTRLILNLLPLIQNARQLRRVVSVGAASYEGPIVTGNIPGIGLPLLEWRDHFASCLTLLLSKVAQRAPDVGFVHTCPGVVKSGIMRDMEPTLRLRIMVTITGFLAPLINTSPNECGERHLFAATSARYAVQKNYGETSGVSSTTPIHVARGIDGRNGSGVYSVDAKGESATPKVEGLLKAFKENGTAEALWQYVLSDYMRITRSEVLV